MTSPPPSSPPSPLSSALSSARVLGRLGAAFVASSVGLHLLMLHHMAAAPAAFMVVLAAVCAPCGLALWRGGSRTAWATTALMAGLMLAVHHGWALHEMAGHGLALSVSATVVASAEALLALTALATSRPVVALPGGRPTTRV